MYTEVAAAGCLVWYVSLVAVCTLGTVRILRQLSSACAKPRVSTATDHIPHVTIIRPCKGIEPYLYECLVSTCTQHYPSHKLTVHLCVASRSDPAYPLLTQLTQQYPDHDIRVFIEDEDLHLQRVDIGPNPKIRNMSRAYREAKGEIVWILDCNIWVTRTACARVVDHLCGFVQPSTPGRAGEPTYHHSQQHQPYKLVAHLPVAVSVDHLPPPTYSTPTTQTLSHVSPRPWGSLLEQSFLSSAHAKMYVAINTVSIAPCINGKSTAFRRSHLDSLTNGQGIDDFGQNICEDHLIGDLLWKSHVPSSPEDVISSIGSTRLSSTGISARPTDDHDRSAKVAELRRTNPGTLEYKNHGLILGDLAFQPISSMSVCSYVARRVRWLRVRKFTVPAATLIEPATESVVCSAIGAWGATTWRQTQEVFGSSWWNTGKWWIASMTLWCVVDYVVFRVLQSGATVPTPTFDEAADTKGKGNLGSDLHSAIKLGNSTSQTPRYSIEFPPFVKPLGPSGSGTLQGNIPFLTWFAAWLGREFLALPVWSWAIWGGTTVTWRDQRFWVGMDMKVHAIDSKEPSVRRFEDDGKVEKGE